MRIYGFLLMFTLATVSGCADDDPSRPQTGNPGATSRRWYAGDFHVHSSVGSNDTRGPDGSLQSYPDAIRRVAIERGMSFLVITDHSNSAGSDVTTTAEDADLWNHGPEFPLWETAAGMSSPDFLMVDGSEISPVSTLTANECPNCPTRGSGQLTPTGHIGCAPLDLATFDRSGVFVDRPPGQVSGGSGVDQCHQRGGFAIINHPFYRSTPWIDYDWTSYAYDAIEIFNGSAGFASFDRAAYDAYLCDRLAGRDVVGVGGSDNHRTLLPYDESITLSLGPPLGMPMTSVFAKSLDWADIVQAVRQGHIVVHDRDTFVEFEFIDSAGKVFAAIGDRLNSPATTTKIRLRGRSPRPQELRLLHAAPGSCSERRQTGRDFPPVVASTVVHTQTVCQSAACEFDEQIEVSPTSGLYYATVGEFATITINGRDVAVTNVVTVE